MRGGGEEIPVSAEVQRSLILKSTFARPALKKSRKRRRDKRRRDIVPNAGNVDKLSNGRITRTLGGSSFAKATNKVPLQGGRGEEKWK